MKDVQRWEVTHNSNGLGFSDGIRQSPHGNFVSIEDYRALEARIAKADAFSELFRAWRHSDSVSDRVPLMARVISAEPAYRESDT